MKILARMVDATPSAVASRLGTTSSVARAVRPLVNRLLPSEPIVVTVLSGAAAGLRLPVYPRHEKYYWTGTYEAPVQEALVERLAPGQVFWDIGAHIGFFSVLAARLTAPDGLVHAFEPVPGNRSRLLHSIQLNGVETVAVHGFAVSGSSGLRQLRPHASTSMWSIHSECGSAGLPVQCRTLDDLAEELGRPDLIKIDAEDAELDILRGGLSLFSGLDARTAAIVEVSATATLEAVAELVPARSVCGLGERHLLVT